MSTTFFMKNHSVQIETECPYFNPDLPEDKWINPRMMKVEIYPEAKFSGMSTHDLLDSIREVPSIVGEWSVEKLPIIENRLSLLIKHNEPHSRAALLLRVVRTAIAMKSPVVWA